MTKDGQANRFGRFIFADEQAERVGAGDLSAVWEFLEDNRKYLTCWAKKYLRNHLFYLPQDMYGQFYKPEELLNQIYVDFPYYKLENDKTLGVSIHCSFRGITSGGYKRSWYGRRYDEISLDTPLSVSERSGNKEEEGTLLDLLPSREPTPEAALIQQEHVKEIAPRYYNELGRIVSGASVGELLAYNEEKRKQQQSAFQDVIEEVFFGYKFEEIKSYATSA